MYKYPFRSGRTGQQKDLITEAQGNPQKKQNTHVFQTSFKKSESKSEEEWYINMILKKMIKKKRHRNTISNKQKVNRSRLQTKTLL